MVDAVEPVTKKLLGVRYEPSISTGTLLILAGMAGYTILFWSSIEHRITVLEDAQQHTAEVMSQRIQARVAIDGAVAGDLAKLHDQLNDLGLRVYKLEIVDDPPHNPLKK